MEKDRARHELRALLADPAAGFAAVSGDEFFAARDGARVEGKAGYGGSKKTARKAAALSLLAALTGLAVPADDTRPPPPAASRTIRG